MVGLVDDFSEAKPFFWAGLFPRPVDLVRTVHGDGLISRLPTGRHPYHMHPARCFAHAGDQLQSRATMLP